MGDATSSVPSGCLEKAYGSVCQFELVQLDVNLSRVPRRVLGGQNQIAQRGARTHDPEIKSLMLYRLS